MDELLQHKLDTISEDIREVKDDTKKSLTEIKKDIKALNDEAPIHRIKALEDWRRGVTAFLVAVVLSVIGAWVVVLFR